MNAKIVQFVSQLWPSEASLEALPSLLERAEACGILPICLEALQRDLAWAPLLKALRVGALLPSQRLDAQALDLALDWLLYREAAQVRLYQLSLQRALVALDDIPSLCLKGQVYALRFSGAVRGRSSSDIDLFIPKDRLKEAEQRLQESGYHFVNYDNDWASNQHLMVHELFMPIELHWALAPPPWRSPSFEEAYQKSEPCMLAGGIETRSLNHAMTWLHLILHAQQHLFAIKPLIDIAMALETIQADEALLQHYGLSRLSQFYRNALACCLGEPEQLSASELCFVKAYKHFFIDHLLGKKGQIGELVFGQDSVLFASLGVLAKAFSMMMLDGRRYQRRAIVETLFFGPHRLGRRLR